MDNGDEEDDWDSDSEDDLQIVLNDNNHMHMVMDRTGVMGSDDEDGDPLVIVADSEPAHQPIEEQEWGEDAAQDMDGERKESGDAAKMNGGVAVAPKIGYNYHPYHSQFKVSDVVRAGFCVFALFDENSKCNLNCDYCTDNGIGFLSVVETSVMKVINDLVCAFPNVVWKDLNKIVTNRWWDLQFY